MPYCTACGHENQEASAYCTSCGQRVLKNTAELPKFVYEGENNTKTVNKDNTDTLRIVVMVAGIVAALILLVGGFGGFVTGGFFSDLEDVLETEFDDPDDLVTTEDVETAGGLAIFTALVFFIGSVSAKGTTRFSLITLIIALILVILCLTVDPTSLFAFAYYMAALAACANVIMMLVVYWRTRHA